MLVLAMRLLKNWSNGCFDSSITNWVTASGPVIIDMLISFEERFENWQRWLQHLERLEEVHSLNIIFNYDIVTYYNGFILLSIIKDGQIIFAFWVLCGRSSSFGKSGPWPSRVLLWRGSSIFLLQSWCFLHFQGHHRCGSFGLIRSTIPYDDCLCW